MTSKQRLMEATTRQNRAGGGKQPPFQLLHLVFGGELETLDAVRFKNLGEVDIAGIFPNYAEAYKAWKAKAQQTVDNAHMRYFIVHLHRLMAPCEDGKPAANPLEGTR